jgi:hypothetical protein
LAIAVVVNAVVATVVLFVPAVCVAAVGDAPVRFPPIDKPAAVPVIFVPTNAEGVPNAGVTKVGLFANTAAPEPVSSVSAAAKFALDGVAKNVATPVPKPETPVDIGSPVDADKLAATAVAVIVPAAKLPDPSRRTNVLAVFVDAYEGTAK